MATQTLTKPKTQTTPATEQKPNQEYSMDNYLKEFGFTIEDCKDGSIWEKMPDNHQPLMCMEGMIYGILVRHDGVLFKNRK